MRFHLEYRPGVRSFLDGLTLSRAGRLRLFNALLDLRRVSDAARADSARRLGSLFVFRRRFRDDGRFVTVRFFVDDGPAAYGVLRVVYADLA